MTRPSSISCCVDFSCNSFLLSIIDEIFELRRLLLTSLCVFEILGSILLSPLSVGVRRKIRESENFNLDNFFCLGGSSPAYVFSKEASR